MRIQIIENKLDTKLAKNSKNIRQLFFRHRNLAKTDFFPGDNHDLT